MISLSSGDSSRDRVPGQQRDVTPVLAREAAGHRLPEVPEQPDHGRVPFGDHRTLAQRVLGRVSQANKFPMQVQTTFLLFLDLYHYRAMIRNLRIWKFYAKIIHTRK